jgi:hypothetical protein
MHSITTEAEAARDAYESIADRRWVIDDFSGEGRSSLERVLLRPELAALAAGLSFRRGAGLDGPFRAPTARAIELADRTLDSEAALVVLVRHALEAAMWHRIAPAPRPPHIEVASACLACCTTLRFTDTLPAADRAAALAAQPEWFRYLSGLFRVRNERAGDVRLAQGLVGYCTRLLPLQGAPAATADAAQALEGTVARLVSELLAVAAPAERLLAWGGDSRLALDPQSRLNKYGCSTVPRPAAITFSSCTASSTSDIGYRSAERTRERLFAAMCSGQSFHDACSELIEGTRQQVGAVLGLDRLPGAEVVLAASGTDCELFALHAALQGHGRDLESIVIGPDEIGGGSLPAASGCHFDAIAPLTRAVPVGTPVEGLAVDRLKVETLPLRDRLGTPVPIAEVDRAVSRMAHDAVGRGARVLVHLVDSSKTGMRAPSMGAVRRLQDELGDELTVLIDAAQMRTRTEQLLECVAAGAMVMISGSKFFTGAPFSGALVVPPYLAARLDRANALPNGLGAYLSRLEVPPRWVHLRDRLPATPNIGLLMRWRTALEEIQAFRAVPLATQNEWYRAWREAAERTFATTPALVPVPAPVGDRGLEHAEGAWDEHATIFTFFLEHVDNQTRRTALMDYEQTWQIYTWLNRDVSALLAPDATAQEREMAAVPCHVGQPVKLKGPDGRVKGALRVAVGSRYVSRLAFDRTLGDTPEVRMRAQLRDLEHALNKTALLVRQWTHLSAQASVA